MSQEKKFGLVEILVVVPIVFLTDLFDIVAILLFPVPVLGQVLLFSAKITSLAVWLLLQLWLYLRGVRGIYYLVGSFIDVYIPFSQTIALVITIFVENHPKLAAVAETVAIGAVTGGTGAVVRGSAAAAKAAQGARAGKEAVSATRTARALSQAREVATQYIPYGEEATLDERLGTAVKRNFAQTRRAEELLTPEAAKDPTDRLMKELFYDIHPRGEGEDTEWREAA
ncbi:MAG: hypothetical protein KGZ30_04135 [Anaplasmataceae bacterium]|nr:hypothetical protein [Anaplasmataceae bacterium]